MVHGLKDELVDALRGYVGLTYIKIPSGAEVNMVLAPNEPMEFRRACVIFGFAIIMLFKNVTVVDFSTYSNNLIRDLSAVVGYAGQDDQVKPFDFSGQAIAYRNLFGKVPGVKKAVLHAILLLGYGNTLLANVCFYVRKILAWTDMSGLVLIHQTLLLTNSPVLLGPEVAAEIKNLYFAFRKIVSSPMPQYYGILCNPIDYFQLDRNNFPILMAVAQALRMEISPTLSQFQFYEPERSPVVRRLIGAHKQHFQRISNRNMDRYVTFLSDQQDHLIDD